MFRQRLHPINLDGGGHFLTAEGVLVSIMQFALDSNEEPVFSGGGRVYDRSGNVISLTGRDAAWVHPEDIVLDLRVDLHLVPDTSLEVLLELGRELSWERICAVLINLDNGMSLTVKDLEWTIDQLIKDEPRFSHLRELLINAHRSWTVEAEAEAEAERLEAESDSESDADEDEES